MNSAPLPPPDLPPALPCRVVVAGEEILPLSAVGVMGRLRSPFEDAVGDGGARTMGPKRPRTSCRGEELVHFLNATTPVPSSPVVEVVADVGRPSCSATLEHSAESGRDILVTLDLTSVWVSLVVAAALSATTVHA